MRLPASQFDYAYQRRLARDIGYSYGRLLALGKTALAILGVTHHGRARKLDVANHHGFWRGLSSN